MGKTESNFRKYKSRGRGNRRCRRCGTHKGLIRKYGLYYCRRCFREVATKLGFKKLH